MALEQVSSVVKSTYLNNVAGYEIQYNIAQDEGQSVKSVTGKYQEGGRTVRLYQHQRRWDVEHIY